MAALTPAMLSKVAERFTAAIKAQEKYAADNAGVRSRTGKLVNADADGLPYRGIMLASAFGVGKKSLFGKSNAVAVLEAVIAEITKEPVIPYMYEKTTEAKSLGNSVTTIRTTGTLIEVLSRLLERKAITAIDSGGLWIHTPDYDRKTASATTDLGDVLTQF